MQSEESPFWWLHSVDHPDVAVPVTTPWPFFAEYEVKVTDEDARQLEVDSAGQTEVLCVVCAAEQLTDFTVNLVAPVVVNTVSRIGRQIINETRGYAVREPLFSEVDLNSVQTTAPGVPMAARGV